MRTMVVGALVCVVSVTMIATTCRADDQNGLAQNIKAVCTDECSVYMNAEGIRSKFEAAACMCMCFYRKSPADEPGRESMKTCAIENAREARKYGSNIDMTFK